MAIRPLPFDSAAFEHRIPKFWARVDRSQGPTECWPWTGAMNDKGYGQVRVGDHILPPHRIAYALLVGPIPDGLVIDHLCRHPECVNPAHMEPVTHGENTLRGTSQAAVNARKVVCIRGHQFLVRRQGKRDCQQCQRVRRAERRALKVAS